MPESAVGRVVALVASGRVDAAEVVPALRAALGAGGVADDSLDATLRRLAGVEDDRDGGGTWTEVEAARVTGRLTEEQYAVLRAGVLGHGR
ncbi:hypothetical protein [Nocardioides perillae]|uniref:DNA-binding NarL/FixJ family response regulator n=1 Tax=Nocardioides perillae TaxID=1119534 RepID=A0A7Y9UV24_9ACTN|nr:hypothetical protein [Nocardioides perillae]NYG54960.1 DNA-binding NarL/FixJ family response regulator [Nocardioides perillae]